MWDLCCGQRENETEREGARSARRKGLYFLLRSLNPLLSAGGGVEEKFKCSSNVEDWWRRKESGDRRLTCDYFSIQCFLKAKPEFW